MRVITQKCNVSHRIIKRKKDFLLVITLPKKREWHLFEFEVI